MAKKRTGAKNRAKTKKKKKSSSVDTPTVVRSTEQFEPEWDARTLMDAQVILADTKRRKAAVKAAEKLAKEKEMEANSMKKVSNMKATTRGNK